MLMNKDVLRTEYKAVRKQVENRKEADIAITKSIIAHELFNKADAVLTYVSFGDEADTRRLIVYMLKNGKKVAVPYCQDKQMYFFAITSPSELILGKDGIPTVNPIGKIPFKPTENTLCIVPAIAFDKSGNRLGYGGGYYDRYLTVNKVNTIGICYQNCITDTLPANNLDVKIPVIITESNVYDTTASGSEAPETEKENNPESEIQAKKETKKFEVHISDNDYNAPGTIDETKITKFRKKKFEVKINDNDYDAPLDTNADQPEYKGEVYFGNSTAQRGVPQQSNANNDISSNSQPVKPEPAKTEKPKAKQTSNKKGIKKHALAVMFAAIIIFTTAFSALGISCINDILAIGRESETITVNIPEDATTDEVIEILADNGVIKQEFFCKLYYQAITWFKNLNKDGEPPEPVYKSGPHYVDRGMGLEGCLLTIRGIVKENDTVTLVFPEGWTIYQIVDKLDEFNVCDREELLTALASTEFDFDYIDSIPYNANRTFTLEGYIFPDTYEFYEDSDANTVIRKFLESSDTIWTDEMQARADELGMTRDEIIIIASIIQREAANKEQMSMISAVLHNRLNNSATYPTLECDSTVNYIEFFVGPMSGMSESDYYIYAHDYNTYSSEGLPPGPICNPGEDAIMAALYPSEAYDDYFFFRHDKYGKIYMARTDAEHSANGIEVNRVNNQY